MVQQPVGAVVVGVDGSEKDRRAVDWAADEAAATGVGLHILYCLPTVPEGLGVTLAVDLEQLGAAVTARYRDRAQARHPDLTVTSETVVEDPAVALVLASHRAAVVVVGARGLGRIAGRLLGSVSQKVAAYAHGVVVVVRDVPAAAGPVVVGVDPLDVDDRILELAFTQAARRAVPVRVVHARAHRGRVDPRVEPVLTAAAEQGSRALTELAEEWADRYPDVVVDVSEVSRHPVEALTAESADAGLVVVGSRGRTGLAGVRLGSVARGVLLEARVVAVVHVGPGT